MISSGIVGDNKGDYSGIEAEEKIKANKMWSTFIPLHRWFLHLLCFAQTISFRSIFFFHLPQPHTLIYLKPINNNNNNRNIETMMILNKEIKVCTMQYKLVIKNSFQSQVNCFKRKKIK